MLYMQTRQKIFVFGLFALAGLFAVEPALAQTYNPNYYPHYTTPYAGQSYGYGGYGCPALSYNLTLGSSDYRTGGQVSQLQSFLRNRYGDSRLTGGYYGQLTTYYVSRFQQEQGVYPVTGGVGPLTRAAIQRVCGGYGTYPHQNPYRPTTTFRLDRDFTLEVGEVGKLRNEDLTITLTQVLSSQYGYGYYYNREPEAARITVTESCRSGVYCLYAPSQTFVLEDGDEVDFRDWTIELRELDHDEATFRVSEDDTDDDDATVEITKPGSGVTVEQGDELDIEWDVSDEPSNASIILDLYDEDDDRVGTIAIVDAEKGEYEWDVPRPNTFCTLQYPNGLCGYDLEGEYYLKASLVRGTGFGGETLDTDTSPVFEIED